MADETSVLLVAQSTLRTTSITYGFTIGSRLPLMHTAAGRVLLAYGKEEWVSANLANAPIHALTAESLTNRDAIAAEVEAAMRKGFAIVRNEFENEITGIAVPIGLKGEVRAALGISELSSTLADEARAVQVINTLRRTASELTRAKLF
jgi:IclR family pca regulon transcriptional regulator